MVMSLKTYRWSSRTRQWIRLMVIVAAVLMLHAVDLFVFAESPTAKAQENLQKRDSPHAHPSTEQIVIQDPKIDHALEEKHVVVQHTAKGSAFESEQVVTQKTLTDDAFKAAFEALIRQEPGGSIVSLMSALEKDGSGNKGIHAVGHRTRQYAKYLGIWTDLNFVKMPSGRIEVRDNILQYIRTHSDFVESVGHTISSLTNLYETYQQFIYGLGELLFPFTPEYLANHMMLLKQFSGENDRGIALTGNDDRIGHLLTNVATLRRLGCTLPVEVLFLGDNDLSRENRAALEEFPGVVTRDLKRLVSDDDMRVEGFTIKPFAILFSSFREVLFIDADALFLRNPVELFDDPGYVRTGALFFKDRRIWPENKREILRELLPRPISDTAKASRYWTGKSSHYQESGVVVVDKWQHYVPMLLTCRLNAMHHEDIDHFMYGDKESFWLSWELSGSSSYDMHDGRTGILGSYTPQPDNRNATRSICSPQLLHADREGKPLWFNGWIANSRHDDAEKRKVSLMNAYIYEPEESPSRKAEEEQKDFWKDLTGNRACLESDKVYTLTSKEREVVGMLVEEARRADAID